MDFYLILAGIIFALFLTWYLIIKKIRSNKDLERSMDLIFLRLSFPIKDSKEDKEKESESLWTNAWFKEYIDVMSQLYESLYSTYSWDFINKIIWEDFFSFEVAIIDKELQFFVVLPRWLRNLFEKQISAYYTDIFIDEESDYNIFKKWAKASSRIFTLWKENFYPIKTYHQMASDPMNAIINAMSKMEEDEWAAIQVILRPVWDWWQKEGREKAKEILEWKEDDSKWVFYYVNPLTILKFLFNALSSEWEIPKWDDPSSGWRVSQVTEEQVKAMEEKNTRIWYECIIRVITSAPTKHQANLQRDIISSAFTQYWDPDTNMFLWHRRHSDEGVLKNFVMRNFDIEWNLWEKMKPMILTSREISSVLHFPNIKYSKSTVIKWQEFKIAPAPSILSTQWVLLWINSYRWVDKEIRISRDDRRRHFYLIWKSGTWKSTLIETLVRQDFANWDWVAVIDPHGDLVEAVLPYIPRHRADDVIIFDPWDLDRPMWVNILEAHGEDQKEFVAQEALAIFIKLFGEEIMWPRLQHYFRNWVLTLMADDDEWATVLDIPRLFTDDAFAEYKQKKVTNPEVRSFWDKEMANTWEREKQEMIPYFSSKFWPFKTNAQIRNIIWQPKSWFDFRDVMDWQKILLINLSKGKLWDLNSKLLGMIMVAKLQMAAMSRVDTPENERHDFYMYVDEFQNFVTDSFASILSEARKYRLNLIIAHQYISQITKMQTGWKWSVEDTTIRDAVFWNVWSMMNFKIWAADAETMAKEFAPVFSEQDLVNIANYNAYIKLNVNWTTTRWFSMKTIYDTSWADEDAALAYKQLSRLKNARKREFVEKEIIRRIG